MVGSTVLTSLLMLKKNTSITDNSSPSGEARPVARKSSPQGHEWLRRVLGEESSKISKTIFTDSSPSGEARPAARKSSPQGHEWLRRVLGEESS